MRRRSSLRANSTEPTATSAFAAVVRVQAPYALLGAACRGTAVGSILTWTICRSLCNHCSSTVYALLCAGGSSSRACALTRHHLITHCRHLPHKIAIVDIGSTSFKLLIATMDVHGNVVALHEEKRQVRLLSGEHFTTITNEALMRAVGTIGYFAQIADEHGLTLHCIATAGARHVTWGLTSTAANCVRMLVWLVLRDPIIDWCV